jgi:hypothetical protein
MCGKQHGGESMTTTTKKYDVAIACRVWISATQHLHRAVSARPPRERDKVCTALNTAAHIVEALVKRVEAEPNAAQSALPIEEIGKQNQEVGK